MNAFKTATLASAALATALVLAGCSSNAGSSSSSSSSASGMSGMDMPSSSASATASTGSTHTSADVTFAQMMIAHHMQAIQMSDMVLAKTGVDPRVTDLATKIKAAQTPEIDQMNGFLTSWGQKTVTTMSGMSMGGMMSQADMDALDKASGSTASSLFLTQMVQHHTGAVAMANDEVKNGASTEAVALAKKIVSDQTAEISAMKALLKNL